MFPYPIPNAEGIEELIDFMVIGELANEEREEDENEGDSVEEF